ncbi:hypothetical protein MK489_10370 [Myxococcota bacterium]|nr:hypothetical protein [Myxococcota bacterium]
MRMEKIRASSFLGGLCAGLLAAWGVALLASAQAGGGTGMLASVDSAGGTIILESREVLHVTPSSRMRNADGVWIGLEGFPVPKEGEPVVVYYETREESGRLEVVRLELGNEVPR